MSARILVTLGLLLVSTPAWAAPKPDLTSAISTASGAHVYESRRYTVTVSNVGNGAGSGSSVTIQLPRTNTSPNVYVMGELGAKHASCSVSGTRLVCSLGTIAKGGSASVWFDLALPESTDPLTITAMPSASGETNTGNNGSSHTASLANYDVAVSAPVQLSVESCTGTDLTSFWECVVSPGSTIGYEIVLEADTSVSVVGDGGYYDGSWIATAQSLSFEITDGGTPVVQFTGYGVPDDCWEGVVDWNDGTVSPYSVCQ